MKKPPAKKPNNPNQSDDDGAQVVAVAQATWSGPLPPPSALAQYNDVVPNGAERIFAAWEEESLHRRKLESRDLTLDGVEIVLGRLGALVFVVTALAVIAYCASIGAEWVAAALGSTAIASIVFAFVKTRNQK